MNYKGIIFDLDGTLADTLTDIADSVNRILEKHGFQKHPVEQYKLMIGNGLDNLVKRAIPETSRQPELVSRCLTEMINDYAENCLNKTCLYPGIRELLNNLVAKKFKMAVFSNKAHPLTLKIVDHLLKDISFVNVIGARQEYPKKPDPAVALLLSDQMGLSPKDIIYVGDSDVDMMTATQAGMLPVGVLWGFRSKDELVSNGARILLSHPSELLKYI